MAEQEAYDFNQEALKLIGEGRLAEAREILERAVALRPSDWQPLQEGPDGIMVYCWSLDEFLSYCAGGPQKNVTWLRGSYSRAYCSLGWMAAERGCYEEALELLDEGLRLEPDHPDLRCEKGYVLLRLRRFGAALEEYQKAETCRPWATRRQKARAVRGQGISLIDLGDLDRAELELIRSLEFEPDSPLAHHELAYIAQRRQAQ